MSHQTLLLAVFALVCHMSIELGWARSAHDCFFVDGKALCGEEGQLAREQQRLSIEAKLVPYPQQAEWTLNKIEIFFNSTFAG